MIRKLTYFSLFILFLLIGLNLIISHALATDGEELARISLDSQEYKEKIGSLRRQVIEAQSLREVNNKLSSLGFVGSVQYKIISGVK